MPEPTEGGAAQAEMIRVGESFKLFSQRRTMMTIPERDAMMYQGLPDFESHITLDTNGLLPPIPIDIYTLAIYKNKMQAFTPFSPQDGYQVTTDDFEAETRVAKRSANPDDRHDIQGSPLVLALHAGREDFSALGLLDKGNQFTAEALRTLNRVRLQLAFPNGLRFESRPQFNIFQSGNLEFFGGFYPVDAKPLPIPGYMRFLMDEGLQISLPAEGKKLQAIDGEFLLAPPA